MTAMPEGQTPIETVVFPEGSPAFAYDLMRDRLLRQQMALDALDGKLALSLGLSGAMLGILAAFLGLKEDPFASGAGGLFVGAACLFGLNVVIGLFGLWPRQLPGITWDQIKEKATGEWPEAGVQWSLAQTLAWTTDETDKVVRLKAWLVEAMLSVFVIEAVLVAGGITVRSA